MTIQEDDYRINRHYGYHNLGETIIAALQTAGKQLGQLMPDDLAR
jgi:hypothetical protein